MKLEDKDLAPATSPLVGFNSQPEWPIEKIIFRILGAQSSINLQLDLRQGLAARHASSCFDLPPSHALSGAHRAN
ncbi:hypothetical protein CsSME_00022302 [Camellia sinensis var. sinensis]